MSFEEVQLSEEEKDGEIIEYLPDMEPLEDNILKPEPVLFDMKFVENLSPLPGKAKTQPLTSPMEFGETPVRSSGMKVPDVSAVPFEEGDSNFDDYGAEVAAMMETE